MLSELFSNVRAELLYDYSEHGLRLPAHWAAPLPGQMEGTEAERLTEACGRICYDSVGLPKARPSVAYHAHINETNHGSVQEHFNVTLAVDYARVGYTRADLLEILINRPGLWTVIEDTRLRVTLNLRSIRDWHRWSRQPGVREAVSEVARQIGDAFLVLGHRAAPHICALPAVTPDCLAGIERVEPEYDQEKWISLYLFNSRGCSHEQVRHKFRTAVSQRSTRYVDESESPYVMHPLLRYYLTEVGGRDATDLMRADDGSPIDPRWEFVRDGKVWLHSTETLLRQEVIGDRRVYDVLVARLQPWLRQRGVEGTNARKQARGVARGLLGNALATDMVFSASVAEWRWMLSLRAADAAYAEIRELFAADMHAVLPELRKSRYADRFEDVELVPATDGIGWSAQFRC